MKPQSLARRIELLEMRNQRAARPMVITIYGALTDSDEPEVERRTLPNGRKLTVIRSCHGPDAVRSPA